MNTTLRLAPGGTPAPAAPDASGVSRPPTGTALGIEPLEEWAVVGGCGGLFCIPAVQQAEYYRAQRCMAMLGLVFLPVLLVLGPLF